MEKLKINWDNEFNEAREHLRNLIRFDTSNPPGYEKDCALYIKQVLEKEKIPATIYESAPGRANLIARLKAKGKDKKKPFLLTSHLDVVPANPEGWKYPPFSAEVADGFIWGRGAVDMKQMTAMELQTMLILKRNKIPLNRDVVLVCFADEEEGSEYGAKWMVANHPEELEGEFALGEIGGFSIHFEGKTFYPVQTAEKGYCWFKIIARGDSGHGSVPIKNNAISHLAKAIDALTNKGFPFHLTPIFKNFIVKFASALGYPQSLIMKQILNPWLSSLILDYLIPERGIANSFYAALHNTANPTGLKAGEKINVIPQKAELLVDGRILPGFSINDYLKEVRDLIGEKFQIEVLRAEEATVFDHNTELFRKIIEIIRRYEPQAEVIPHLTTGFTDAHQLARLGVITYGFCPMKLPKGLNFARLFHGVDERIPISSFDFGVRALYELVSEFCAD